MSTQTLTVQQAQILAQWNAGKGATEIAETLGVTRNVVIGHVSRLRARGIDVREGQGAASSRPRAPRRADAVFEAENREIITLWEQGFSPQEIGDRLGLSRIVINSRVKKLREQGHALRSLREPGARRLHARSDEAVLKRLEAKRPAAPASAVERRACFTRPLEGVQPISLFALAPVGAKQGTCRWPLDMPQGVFFCGAVVEGKSSYCPCHTALTRPVATQERRAA